MGLEKICRLLLIEVLVAVCGEHEAQESSSTAVGFRALRQGAVVARI